MRLWLYDLNNNVRSEWHMKDCRIASSNPMIWIGDSMKRHSTSGKMGAFIGCQRCIVWIGRNRIRHLVTPAGKSVDAREKGDDGDESRARSKTVI